MTPDTPGDFSADELRAWLHRAADWIADYRETIAQRPVAPDVKPGGIESAFSAAPPEQAVGMPDLFAQFDRAILPGILHWGHPRFLGYFGCTTTAPGIVAEMLAAALNVNAMTWRVSPAASELEGLVLRWLRQMLGLPAEFEGVVFDTASVGLVHALAAARENAPGFSVRKHGLGAAPRLRIYASDQAHSSAEKAAIVLGIGEENVVRIASDAQFALRPDALRAAIAEDARRGFKPMAVIATIGTTSTASVDPVPEIADICAAEKLWLHVDAAYGGAIALLPERRALCAGWERADSIIINPHKWLFVPLDFSALFLRDLRKLRAVFSLVPEYLRADALETTRNYMDYGFQLGRRFRALKAWMVWSAFGREGLEQRIREHCRLAERFAEWVENDARFELMAPVRMGVVCFRARDFSDEQNARLADAINAGGETWLTQTKLRGVTALRIGLGNILTTEQHLAEAWEAIRRERDRLAASRNVT